MALYIFIALIVVTAFTFISIYNGLIKKKNNVENSFSGIDVILKKRYDLIPNLVETVKTFMNHEKDLLTEITALRSQAMKPNLSTDDKVKLNNQISNTMGNIMVAVEKYPDIKSNTNFLQLQNSWENIETDISNARLYFNATVLTLNNAIEMFPSSLVAGFMNLTTRAFFETPEEEKKNVSAKELFAN